MTRTGQSLVPARSRRDIVLMVAAATLGAALVALAATGVTSALWRTELTTHGAVPDAAVLFSVNGDDASSADPTATVTLGSTEMQSLLDTRSLAVPIEVEALSQGNRGLRYTVELPATAETDILHWAEVSLFPVDGPAACTVDAVAPSELPPLTSTPVSATYSDATAPTIEHWCLRADLDALPDEGVFTTTTTVTGTHALGEIVETVPTQIDVTTAFTVADEPTHRISFRYETFRAGDDR